MAGPSANPVSFPADEDWGSAAFEWDLLDLMDIGDGAALDPGVAADEEGAVASALTPELPRPDLAVVPYEAPPPAEVELLPGAAPVADFVEQLLLWRSLGMSYPDVLLAARALWGVRYDDDLPRLRLALQLVYATRRQLAINLLEAALAELLIDPTGTTVLARLLQDLLYGTQ